MWDQVNKNDFSKRSIALAAEIKQYKPDVIGLQEVDTKSNQLGRLVSPTQFSHV
jgi:mRNA deadenylase 3'-5' endonuclease subunit Ccr4